MANTKRIKKHEYKHFVVPSVIGWAVTYILSGSFNLAVVVLVAVFIGNWIGYSVFLKK